MASAKKEASILKKLKKNKTPVLPEVPEESPYRRIYHLLASAGETGSAQMAVPILRKIWDHKSSRKTPKFINVQVFGFPDLGPSSRRIAVAPGLGEKKINEIKKARPDIHPSYLEYFQYFGEIIPIHRLAQKTLLFGFGGGVWEPSISNRQEIRHYINDTYWAADDEAFPGSPVVLLGYDGENNLWFGVDENEYVWTYDDSIQGVRNANYYDDDEVECITWPVYISRVLKRWITSD